MKELIRVLGLLTYMGLAILNYNNPNKILLPISSVIFVAVGTSILIIFYEKLDELSKKEPK